MGRTNRTTETIPVIVGASLEAMPPHSIKENLKEEETIQEIAPCGTALDSSETAPTKFEDLSLRNRRVETWNKRFNKYLKSRRVQE